MHGFVVLSRCSTLITSYSLCVDFLCNQTLPHAGLQLGVRVGGQPSCSPWYGMCNAGGSRNGRHWVRKVTLWSSTLEARRPTDWARYQVPWNSRFTRNGHCTC